MAATFNKFESFVFELGKGLHHLHAAGDTLNYYLTNNLPDTALDSVKTDLAGITEENGYAVADAQNDYTETTGTGTLTCQPKVWTGTGAGFGPFQYVVLYNVTHASEALVAWWDYGSSISVLVDETFTITPGASIFTIDV